MSVAGVSLGKVRGLEQAPLLLGQLLRKSSFHSRCGEFSSPCPPDFITVKAEHRIKLCP